MDPLSGKPHYPQPVGPLDGHRTVNPRRRLAPLFKPAKLAPLPNPLPESLNRTCAVTSTHTLSLHLLSAAYPRAWCPADSVVIPSTEDLPDKKDRKEWMTKTMERMIWEKKEAETLFPDPEARIRVAEEAIWNAVLRIRRNTPSASGKGITIVALHPVGFHKDVSPQPSRNTRACLTDMYPSALGAGLQTSYRTDRSVWDS